MSRIRHPTSPEAAWELLVELGAPRRLLRHVELVAEAAELVLKKIAGYCVPIDANLVRLGVLLHDVGKVAYSGELDRSGNEHEAAGEALLLNRGVPPELARICRSHAQWQVMQVSFEELGVALADTLWKGVRNAELEDRVLQHFVRATGGNRWSLFIELDTLFEQIAAEGPRRLEQSFLT